MAQRHAVLYRMALPDHVCPYGVKAKQLLQEADFDIEEHVLDSREAVDAFKAEQGVQTTPQVFVDGDRLGGCDDLEAWLAHERAN